MKEFDENKIDDFLLGRMDEKELEEFKNKLSMDKQFAEQVSQRQKSLKYIDILGDLATKKRIQALHQEAVSKLPPEKNFRLRSLLKYAAVIVFLIAAGLWFLSGPPSAADLFKTYYQAYDLSFGERGKASPDAFAEGGRFYAEGNYQQALDQFENLPAEILTAKITLAKGISYLETGQYDQATVAFQSLIDNKDPIYETHARWYLAMNYLKKGDQSRAFELLRQIAGQDGSFNQKKALEILEEENH